MPKDLDIFPLLVDKWYGGTKTLSLEEKGAYLELLLHLFQEGGSIKDDQHVARILGCDPRVAKRIFAVLTPKFRRNSAGSYHVLVSKIRNNNGRIKGLDYTLNPPTGIGIGIEEEEKNKNPPIVPPRGDASKVLDFPGDAIARVVPGSVLAEPAAKPSAKAKTRAKAKTLSYDDCPGFASFWEAYPRRQKKRDAFKVWTRDRLEAKTEDIVSAVKRAAESDDWRKDGGKFVPMPTTYLNGARWEDELEPSSGFASDYELRQWEKEIEQEHAKLDAEEEKPYLTPWEKERLG